ncbi:recombinase family protein [Oryzobacter terrae]|uniref:recombinase family protein n=1 Tax=Oryzobacter terrae TaxID=1620385 RepID=UPI003672CCBC
MRTPKRAAVYCRISDDRSGKEAGVDRQRKDGLDLAAANGWEVVHDGARDVFTDNDMSAFSGRTRPAYARLVDALRAGEIDLIVTWHIDRLYRRPVELESLITLVETTKVTIATVKAGDFDLSTRQGITMARLGVTIANDASMATRERVQARMVDNAEKGKVHGALRTYGLRGTRLADGTHTWEVVPEEAAVIREAAQRVLSGEAVLAVTRDLNARGVPTLRGAQWSRNTLRGILISARVAGWREHTPGRQKGARTGDGQWMGGEFVAEAEWPAILSREEVERLRRALSDPSKARGSGRRYLLSGGLVRCALCAQPLRGRPNRHGSSDYSCVGVSSNGHGCGKVSVRQEAVDHYVIDQVTDAVSRGKVAERLRATTVDTGDAMDLVASLERDLAGLGEDFGRGLITRGEWMAAREPLTGRLERARRHLQRQAGAEALALVTGSADEWLERWATAPTLDAQRAMLRAALGAVEVGPAVRGRNRFDGDRVALRWRGDAA